MAVWGNIDRITLIESFARIKDDIEKINKELQTIKKENHELSKENFELKTQFQNNAGISSEIIKEIVKEALRSIKNEKSPEKKQKTKKKRNLLLSRIQSLAQQKKFSLTEVKDIIVEHEGLCSRATFYRYIEKMQKRGIIDLIKINEIEVLVQI